MRNLFLFIILLLPFQPLSASIPADMSFIVIDLKYNSEDGVKICEIQDGLGCSFSGPKYFEGDKRAFSKIFVDFVDSYFNRIWYVHRGLSVEFKNTFDLTSKWKKLDSFKKILTDNSSKKYVSAFLEDPSKLSDYHGLFICQYRAVRSKILEQLNSLIVMNRAFNSAFGNGLFTDKIVMGNLMNFDEKLMGLKPAWKAYPKGYSQELIDQISHDFSSDMIVIKPRAGTQGCGIIILHKRDLEKTLTYIFSKSSMLKNDPDKAYNWWATDNYENFIIEEFIPSDPVCAPHLSDDVYDGTMRIPLVLTYDNGEINLHILYAWWKLPPKSLNEEGTLTEKHKSLSLGPNTYVLVSQDVLEKVEKQLNEALPILYQDLLENGF